MPDQPSQRRRRASAPRAPERSSESAAAEGTTSEGTTSERPPAPKPAPKKEAARPSSFNVNVIWALVTGLAVGFAAGREAYRFGLGDGQATSSPSASSTAFIAAEKSAVNAYAHQTDFPAGWVKDSDLSNGGAVLAGLTDAQKTTVMQALNERNCECGCPYGTLAHCLQKDPNCPRSPAMAKLAVDLVKQGKSLGEILTAIDDKQQDMSAGQKPQAAPPPPTTPVRVELAAWNPRKGPKAAKVTIVEFSDFQ